MKIRSLAALIIFIAVFVGFTGCTLFDNSADFVFTDYSTELSAIKQSVRQIFSNRPIQWHTPPETPLDVWHPLAPYIVTDLYDYLPVTGVQQVKPTIRTITPTLNHQAFLDTSSVTLNSHVLTRTLRFEMLRTHPTANQYVKDIHVTGNIRLENNVNLDHFAFNQIDFSVTENGVIEADIESISTLNLALSLPFTFETETELLFSGTLAGTATDSSSPVRLSSDILLDGQRVGSVEVFWTSYSDFESAAPTIQVKDERNFVVEEI